MTKNIGYKYVGKGIRKPCYSNSASLRSKDFILLCDINLLKAWHSLEPTQYKIESNRIEWDKCNSISSHSHCAIEWMCLYCICAIWFARWLFIYLQFYPLPLLPYSSITQLCITWYSRFCWHDNHISSANRGAHTEAHTHTPIVYTQIKHVFCRQ